MSWLTQQRDAWAGALSCLLRPLDSLPALIAIAVLLALPTAGQLALRAARLRMPAPPLTVFITPGRDTPLNATAQRVRQMANVREVRTIAQEEALVRMKADPRFAEAIAALAQNPLPDALVVVSDEPAAEGLKRLAGELGQMPGVERVQYEAGRAVRRDQIFGFAQAALTWLAALASLTMLSVAFTASRLKGAAEPAAGGPVLRRYGLLLGLAGALLAGSAAAAGASALGTCVPVPNDWSLLALVGTLLGWLAGAAASVARRS